MIPIIERLSKNDIRLSENDIKELKLLVGQISILCMIGNIDYEPNNKNDVYDIIQFRGDRKIPFIKNMKLYFGFGGKDNYDENLIKLFTQVYPTSFNNELKIRPEIVINNASTSLDIIPVNGNTFNGNSSLKCCIDSIKDPQPSCSLNTSSENFFGMVPRQYNITDNNSIYSSALYDGEGNINKNSTFDVWINTNLNLVTNIILKDFNINNKTTTFKINSVSQSLSAKNIMKNVIINCLNFYEQTDKEVFRTNGYWNIFESTNDIVKDTFMIAHEKCKGDLDQELFALTINGGAMNGTILNEREIYNPKILEITIDRPSFFRMALFRLQSDPQTINNYASVGIMTGTNVMFINSVSSQEPSSIRGGKKKYTRKNKKNIKNIKNTKNTKNKKYTIKSYHNKFVKRFR
jgi:hypothetical protein